MKHRQLPVIAVISLLLLPHAGLAADFKIGSTLPRLGNLQSTAGPQVGSASFADADVLIVAFTSNRCPYAVDYEDRLNELQAWCESTRGEVQLLVINSNYGRDETMARMTERARDKGFRFLYVKDDTQNVARQLGAVYTPEFFVFDGDRRLVYKGALDDSTRARDVTVNYVRQAVDAVRGGQPVPRAEIGARGCTIRFRRRRPNRG